MLVYQALRFRNNNQIRPIFYWFLIRLFSEVSSYVVYFIFNVNPYFVLHTSDLLEGTFIICYFLEFNKNKTKALWLYLVPPIYFFLEIISSGSLNKLNGVSYSIYNSMSALLMLRLLIRFETIELFSKPIIKALFFIHSVSFTYALLEHVIRVNFNLSQIVYPFFLIANLIFNLYLTYYLWSVRKS